MAKKTKVISTSSKPFVKGGSGSMFGKQAAGPKTPGNTAGKSGKGSIAKGGSGHMFGKQSASAMPSGRTGK